MAAPWLNVLRLSFIGPICGTLTPRNTLHRTPHHTTPKVCCVEPHWNFCIRHIANWQLRKEAEKAQALRAIEVPLVVDLVSSGPSPQPEDTPEPMEAGSPAPEPQTSGKVKFKASLADRHMSNNVSFVFKKWPPHYIRALQ